MKYQLSVLHILGTFRTSDAAFEPKSCLDNLHIQLVFRGIVQSKCICVFSALYNLHIPLVVFRGNESGSDYMLKPNLGSQLWKTCQYAQL